MADPARALDALGDPTRRAVLEQLRERPLPVGEIAARLPVSRPAVSRHLRILTDAGLVRAAAVGRNRLYSVATPGLAALQDWVSTFWDDALAALASDVEARVAGVPGGADTVASTFHSDGPDRTDHPHRADQPHRTEHPHRAPEENR